MGGACSFGVHLDGVFDDAVEGDAAIGEPYADGSVADTDGNPNDAGIGDAQPDSRTDGGIERYCATVLPKPTFCDDFDGIDAAAIPSIGSRAETREDDFVSPPRALRVTVDPLEAGTTSAAISVPLLVSVRRLQCRFDLKVEAASGGTSVVRLFFVAGTKIALLDFQLRPTGFRLSEYVDDGIGGIASVAHDETAVRWPSEWMHVDLVWTDAFSSSLVVNGVALETNVPLHPSWFKGLVSVSYGVAYANGVTTTERALRLDNVVIDVE